MSNIDILLNRPAATDPNLVQQYAEAAEFAQLPAINETDLATTIIKTILGFGTALTIVAIVVAGIYLLTSRGNEEQATKAKQILLYLIVGMIIISSAYAIVTGIGRIDFFANA